MPNIVREVVEEFNAAGFPRGKVIISMAGGIPISAYTELGGQLPIVRALPNPPSQVGKGIAALAFNPHVTEDQQNVILELFDCLGDYVVVLEELVNAVMALSSPALTYYRFQSLIDAGIRAGIDHKSATKIVSQTMPHTNMPIRKGNYLSIARLSCDSIPFLSSIKYPASSIFMRNPKPAEKAR